MIYFTSDLHFHHNNILNFGSRPYNNISDNDNSLIKNWNNTISKNDKIYILGDFKFSHLISAEDILTKLNGEKHFILGNHDNSSELIKLVGEGIIKTLDIYKEENMYINGKEIKVIMSHYPILEYNYAWQENTLHLYGHVHENGKHYDLLFEKLGFKAYNVSVDCNNFFPVSLNDIWNKIKNRVPNRVFQTQPEKLFEGESKC